MLVWRIGAPNLAMEMGHFATRIIVVKWCGCWFATIYKKIIRYHDINQYKSCNRGSSSTVGLTYLTIHMEVLIAAELLSNYKGSLSSLADTGGKWVHVQSHAHALWCREQSTKSVEHETCTSSITHYFNILQSITVVWWQFESLFSAMHTSSPTLWPCHVSSW